MSQRLTLTKLIVLIVFSITSISSLSGKPNISCPVNFAFSFSDQSSLDETFSDYIKAFILTEDGCAITSATDLTSFAAPSYTGGTVTILFEATDCSGTASCTATFTAIDNCAGTPPAIPLCPANMTLGNCTSDEEAMAAFRLWLEGFSFTGGCDVTTTDLSSYRPPGCGGTTEVLYEVISQGFAVGCRATFAIPAEVAAPDPIEPIPTMGQWSVICLFLIYMIIGVLAHDSNSLLAVD